MDPASLALSIVPLVVGALRAYKAAYEHLHTLRYYSKEIKRICRNVGVQHCLFTSELQLVLVQALRCPDEASTMVADPSHALWKDDALDARINSCLGKDSKVYYELIESIKEQLAQLRMDLSCFDALFTERQPGERMKHTIDRLRSAMHIAFDKRRYEERILSLRQDNEDLRSIGSYICRSQPDANDRQIVKSPPSKFTKVRSACLALHESLTEGWTCSDPKHDGHVAKLCLEAQVNESVQLDLALTCESQLQDSDRPRSMTSVWTCVRTLTSMADDTGLLSPVDDECQQISFKASDAGPKPTSRPVKRLKLNSPIQGSRNRHCNAPASKDQYTACKCTSHRDSCLGTMTNCPTPSQNARQLLYHDCERQSSCPPDMKVMTLSEAFNQSDSLATMPDQLRLATRLATAVLCFYSTPWLHDQWRTTDISWFTGSEIDEGACLRALHVTTNIAIPVKNMSEDRLMSNTTSQDSKSSDDLQEAQYLYGVPNATLFSLGIALLEIAHRQPLESFRLDRDPNNIFTARRLAQRPSVFGQKYQRLTQRCLQCDFGLGSDLEQPALQGAVYHDVVEQLGDMLAGFEM